MNQFNNTEIVWLLCVFSIGITITGTYIIYKWLVYRDRSILYPLYAARDELVRCVAIGAIKGDDKHFQLFYNYCIDLIDIAHTDFFNLRRFFKMIIAFENLETREKAKVWFNKEIKSKDKRFLQAVLQFNRAILLVFFRKSLLLRIMVQISVFFILFQKSYLVFKLFSSKLDGLAGRLIKPIEMDLAQRKIIYQKYIEIEKVTNSIQSELLHYGT